LAAPSAGAFVPLTAAFDPALNYAAPIHKGLRPQMIRFAPLILLAFLSLAAPPAGAVDWSQAQTVTMSETEYRFTPKKLTFRRGVAYRLHLENHGRELHEFTAPDFIKSAEIGNPEALNADRTEVLLHPGETKDLLFVAKTAGRFRFICADHDWAGMTGKITVK